MNDLFQQEILEEFNKKLRVEKIDVTLQLLKKFWKISSNQIESSVVLIK